MAESIVTDWLSDYEALEPSEIRTFAAQQEHNHEISHALFTVINERLKYPDLLHSICHQFHSFYRSTETELRKFTLQFLPTLIYIYLNSVAQGDKKSCRSVETLLISIYNIEVSNDDGNAKTVTFRMPFLAQASVYHEEKSLNATDLRRWEENGNKDVQWGPLQQVESINAQNRLKVMSALMFVYNQQLSSIQKSALAHLCRIGSQLTTQGFSKLCHAHRSSYGSDPCAAIVPKPLPRIPLSAGFLLELLHAVYFAMFNEFGSIAIQTVEDIHNRALYELLPEVILVTNAVKNSLHANPSGQPSDGPMGISVALTPATTTVTVSKSMITNASFRTKKLPDDIPIQKDDGSGGNTSGAGSSSANNSVSNSGGGGGAGLVSITEESENIDQFSAAIRNALNRTGKEALKVHAKVPFPSAFKKSKDKDKEKDKDKDKEKLSNLLSEIGGGTGNISGGGGGGGSINNANAKDGNKSSHKKEKLFSSRNSGTNLQAMNNTDSSDGMSISPNSIIKRKNSQIEMVVINDLITTATTNTNGTSFTNGGQSNGGMIGTSDTILIGNGVDNGSGGGGNIDKLTGITQDSIDSSSDISSQRSSLIVDTSSIKPAHNMQQASQV